MIRKTLRTKSASSRVSSAVLLSAFLLATGMSTWMHMAQAAIVNPVATAKVSFTFDDGYTSALTQAAPTLQKYGYTGTNYVITSCVGMTTAPNTCKANTDASYMSWTQLTQLKNSYGWEIGSHTVTHPYLATSDPTDQPLPISLDQARQEIVQSKADLAAHGIAATSMAPPYGDYNMPVLAEIAKVYGTMRGFQDTGYNSWPYNEYLIRDQHVEGTTTVDTVKSYIDTAIANKQWLVLTFHDIKTNPSNNNLDYEYSTANLDAIAAYVKSKNLPVVNVSNGAVSGTGSLVPNGTFANGLSGGWTTDDPANIVANNANNGSYPEAVNAIKLNATTRNTHLFSPTVSVDNTNSYVIKSYLNITALSSGGISYYIDEYDGLGNWISGQYKTSENTAFTENINVPYKPSSSTVRGARFQVIVGANSGITAFVDNFEWLAQNDTAANPGGQISQVNNVATGKTFTSTVGESVLESGHPLSYINDQNENTRWISLPQDNAVVSVDLGSSYALNKVSILWAGDTTKSYTIQTSTNATAWTTVATASTNNTSPQLINHTIAATGRYLRIVGGTRWNTTYGNSIWEIGIYGTPSNMLNGTFDGGFTAGGWTTDNATAFKADAGSHGSPANIVNSAMMTSVATNTHLFSPKLAVKSGTTYSLAAYVNVLTRTNGEVGFYIDEYDASGNWISGQYKGGVRATGISNASFSYVPSSTNVAKASLQVILAGNSGITGYIDDIRWN